MEFGDRDGPRRAVRAHRFDRRVQRAHGHRHVARVCGDAGLARSDHRVLPVDAANGGAAAARLAFVALLVGVVEVGAAGALKQIARRRRLVAELPRGAREQGPREQAIIAPHALIRGEIGVADQGADAEAAFRRRFDLVEVEAVHVDQMRGCLDLEFHQVEQVRPAGDEHRALDAGRGSGCVGSGGRLFVGEGFHVRLSATSVMASTMLE